MVVFLCFRVRPVQANRCDVEFLIDCNHSPEKIYLPSELMFFLYLGETICCGIHGDTSTDYPQHMFWFRINTCPAEYTFKKAV